MFGRGRESNKQACKWCSQGGASDRGKCDRVQTLSSEVLSLQLPGLPSPRPEHRNTDSTTPSTVSFASEILTVGGHARKYPKPLIDSATKLYSLA